MVVTSVMARMRSLELVMALMQRQVSSTVVDMALLVVVTATMAMPALMSRMRVTTLLAVVMVVWFTWMDTVLNMSEHKTIIQTL